MPAHSHPAVRRRCRHIREPANQWKVGNKVRNPGDAPRSVACNQPRQRSGRDHKDKAAEIGKLGPFEAGQQVSGISAATDHQNRLRLSHHSPHQMQADASRSVFRHAEPIAGLANEFLATGDPIRTDERIQDADASPLIAGHQSLTGSARDVAPSEVALCEFVAPVALP